MGGGRKAERSGAVQQEPDCGRETSLDDCGEVRVYVRASDEAYSSSVVAICIEKS